MRLDSVITVGIDELSRRQWHKLFTTLTFLDADDNEVTAFDHITERDVVVMPRGVMSLLPKVKVNDLRSMPVMPKVGYTKTLDGPGYEGQVDAVKAMFKSVQGQVIAPPGVGKTEIVLAFAAACKTRTLVVVHTHDLFKQWTDRAAVSVPEMEVGKIVGKECTIGHLTIATAQTLKRYLNEGGKFWRQFGALVIDEAHHSAAETWEWILNACPAYYRFGVTASQKRSDGRQALVSFAIGPVIYKMKFKSQVPMTVQPFYTAFFSKWNAQQYTRLLREVVNDDLRNEIIAKIALAEIDAGNTVLVLSRQIKHLDNIYTMMQKHGPMSVGRVKVVTGHLAKRQRDMMIQGMRDGDVRCILGTQLFEEGVDVPRINRIILAFPGTAITALQKVGRGSRKFEGKTNTIVYDIVDEDVAVLARQWLDRRSWYSSVGIRVEKSIKEVVNGTQSQERRNFRDRFRVSRPHRA